MPDTARIFMNGRSQAVRLPAAYRFKGGEVLIERRGSAVVLREKTETLGDAVRGFFAKNDPVPKDFLKERKDTRPQSRRPTPASAPPLRQRASLSATWTC